MDRNEARDMQHHKGHLGMNTPPIVSPEAWEAACQQMLAKEKAITRARDALAAERRRMLPSASLATSSSPEQPANSEIETVALRASLGESIVIGAVLAGHRPQTTPSARSRRPLAGTASTAARR